MQGELIFVGLGGSVITDKRHTFTLREQNIRRLARESLTALDKRPDLSIVLGHGTGSFAHASARKHGFDVPGKKSFDAMAIAQIGGVTQWFHHPLLEMLLEEGINVLSFHPATSACCSDGVLTYMSVVPISSALALGIVPLLHGDLVANKDGGWSIVSTEEVLAYLAQSFFPKEVVLVGEVDGICTQDPLQNPKATLVREIPRDTIVEVIEMLSVSHGIDVTGGMRSKAKTLYQLVEKMPLLIVRFISGNREGVLEQTLIGESVSRCTVLRF